MDRCPYCGSEDGVYTTYTGTQYYDWSGEPCGFNADVPDNQRVFVRCVSCKRKISLKRILREAKQSLFAEVGAMTREEFFDNYCVLCGSQRCSGIDDEEMREGCTYYQSYVSSNTSDMVGGALC